LVTYERLSPGDGLEATELWLLDRDTLETRPAPVPGDLVAAGFDSPRGRYPRWSPDGRALAAYRSDANMIVVQDVSTAGAEPITIPANLETMAGWSPDGRALAYSEVTVGQPGPHEHVDDAGNVISHTQPSLYNHVVLADLEKLTVTDISAGLEVDEGRPAWHPDGDVLAVARTSTGSGRQLWLAPLDGGELTQLTDDPFFDHTALAWSPDGRELAYMRVPRADGAGVPIVMLLDLESGQTRPIAEAAFIPGWWP
jgi:Tol biopolymer transport system component